MDNTFPSEFVEPIEKEKREYGLESAKVMWHSYTSYGAHIGYNATKTYNFLTEAAQGRQSLDGLKKHMGFVNDDILREGLTYLSLETLPLAPKFINLVQGKLNKIDYDISVDAIDPTSLNQKKQFATSAKAYLNMKSFIETIGVNASDLFQDINPSALPETQDELDIHMQMNYKNEKALEYELGLMEIHNVNDWGQIRRELAFNLIVYGLGVVYTYLDINGQEKECIIPPDRFIFSQTNSESFSDLAWGGHIDYLTPSQLIKEMAADGYTEDEIKEAITQYGGINNYEKYANYGFGQGYYTSLNTDNVNYVPVLRYQFLSEDTYKYVETKNKYGNVKQERKSIKFSPVREELPLYNSDKPTKRLITNTLTNKYGGSWIIGSEITFGYGRKPTPRTPSNKVNAKLDYSAFAPNMQKGRMVSLMAQMIEPLYMANLTWNKIKDILAKERMGILNIDLPRITKIAMTKKSGEPYKEQDILNLFFQSGIGLSSDNTNQHDQSKGTAFSFTSNGLTLTDYMNMLHESITQIRNIIGVNELSDGSTPATNTLNGVMQQSNESTNTALDYLYHAYKHIYHKTSENLLLFKQFNDPDPIPMSEFIVGLNKRPDQVEWEAFYANVQQQVASGMLTTSDQIFLRSVSNLKLAEQIMAARERKRQREALQQKQADIEQQNKAIQEQTILAQEEARKTLDTEWGYKMKYLSADIEGQKEIQVLKNQGVTTAKSIDKETKIQTTIQQGTDSIIKESQRAHSDQVVAANKNKHDKELAEVEDDDEEED